MFRRCWIVEFLLQNAAAFGTMFMLTYLRETELGETFLISS